LTPQIAARAYELYGERAGNDGTAVQDWKKAEQEIRNDEAEAAAKPEAKVEPKPDTKADTPAPEAKADEQKPEAKDKTQPDATPQLVKRVHGLYEQLGREDVQTVQNFEKAEQELKNNETKK
jgi:H+-transporting ATPase